MAERTMSITTPLGGDVLLFNTLDVTEELGRLAHYDITVLSEKKDIDPNGLLGKNVTVNMELPSGGKRYFDAYVVRFALAGKRGRYFRYRITARPWLWFLTRTSDCRIFQAKTAPDIIKEIFNKYSTASFSLKLHGSFRTREYCVQYRETDFNFVSRLMEEEGIYYYMQHSAGKHVVVLANSPSGHSTSKDCPSLPWVDPDRPVRQDQDHVSAWTFSREIQPGAYVLEDYNFKTPSVDLLAKRTESRANAESSHEFYDYPGDYTSADEGKQYVQVRLEELQAQYELAQAQTNARGLCMGDLFKLTGHTRSDQNRDYLVVAAAHQLEYSDYESVEGSPSRYDCSFTALFNKEPFRPLRSTPKPVVHGVQPAIVVGPSGDEIYTDEYGRVKVQFYWDRLGKKDGNSSCWIRVSHPWAGKNYGMVHMPRIGQEVVVDFVEGDPDEPIITGRVYNAEQMPPWALPANMTQSGILTRSSKGGSGANANALRFEDKKGSEQVWLHAEKNQDIEVENDETHWVGHDRKKTIDNDETTLVKHDRTETVGNNEKITIGVNRTENVGSNEQIGIGVNRTEQVGANETITVGANRSVTVGANETKTVSLTRTHSVGINEMINVGAAQEINVGAAQTISVGAVQAISVGADQITNVGASQRTSVGGNQSNDVSGNQSESVGGDHSSTVSGNSTVKVTGNLGIEADGDESFKAGGKYSVAAGDSITLGTGSASIQMKSDGTILIKGSDITIQGSGTVTVKASTDIILKGTTVKQN